LSIYIIVLICAAWILFRFFCFYFMTQKCCDSTSTSPGVLQRKKERDLFCFCGLSPPLILPSNDTKNEIDRKVLVDFGISLYLFQFCFSSDWFIIYSFLPPRAGFGGRVGLWQINNNSTTISSIGRRQKEMRKNKKSILAIMFIIKDIDVHYFACQNSVFLSIRRFFFFTICFQQNNHLLKSDEIILKHLLVKLFLPLSICSHLTGIN
jgi:hypothetical protein